MISNTKFIIRYTCYFISLLKRYKIHFFAWITFIIYEISITANFWIKLDKLTPCLMHIALNISFFYFFAHIVLFKTLQRNKNKQFKLIVSAFLSIITYTGLKYLIDKLFGSFDNHDLILNNITIFSRYLYRAILFVLFSIGYYYLLKFIEERNQKQKALEALFNESLVNEHIEKNLAKAQIDFFKTQINIHFLFKTLSYVYYNILKKFPEEAEVLSNLTVFMRYCLQYVSGENFVPLSTEIEQTKNVLRINNIVKTENLVLHIYADSKAVKARFTPFFLIHLVEVISANSLRNEITINLSLIDKNLHIMATNIDITEDNKTFEAELLKLENRLKEIYLGQTQLKLERQNDTISVKFKITGVY